MNMNDRRPDAWSAVPVLNTPETRRAGGRN